MARCILWFLVVSLSTTAGIVRAEDAAATKNDARLFPLQKCIDDQLKAGRRQVVVPPGQYRVAPTAGQHLRFKDLKDVEIIADGVEMICTQTTRAIVFEHCQNVRFKGLTIDYDPLCYTEAKITALAPDKRWLEFEILPGYPDNTLQDRVEIYDPATGELRRESPSWTNRFESLGNHRYRMIKPKVHRYNPTWDTERVGDILVTNNAFPANAGGHAIASTRCSHLTLEEITLFASPCFGFVEHNCDATTYLRCRVDRRPPATDLVHRSLMRMRSLNADAFHSNEAIVGPAILQCTAKFQGDDCVNIHGVYHFVTATNGNQVRFARTGAIGIKAGDPVEFLPRSGVRPADAVAVKVEPDAPLTAEERAFVEKQNMYPPHKKNILEGKYPFFKATLDRPVSLAMGSGICSGNLVGNGFAVKNCDFGFNRSRAILIKASRGEVSGNTITHGWMAAVLVSPEFWWLESASSSDVVIRDNRIVGCRRAAIEVVAPGGDTKPLPAGAHRNIAITGNVITESAWPNIFVTSTSGLTLKDNQLTPSDPTDFTAPRSWRWPAGKTPVAQTVLQLCDPPAK
jgi:hypothetical protein